MFRRVAALIALVLGAATVLVAGTGSAGAAVANWTFVPNSSCQVQQWTVPATGTYHVAVTGGNGGGNGGAGGWGGLVTGDVTLTAGTILNIFVGTGGDNTLHCNVRGSGYSTDPSDPRQANEGGGFSKIAVVGGSTLFVAGGGGGHGRNGFAGGFGGMGASVEGDAAVPGGGDSVVGGGGAGASGTALAAGTGGAGGAVLDDQGCLLTPGVTTTGGPGTFRAGSNGGDGNGADGGAPGAGPSTQVVSGDGSTPRGAGKGGGGGGGYLAGAGGGSGAYVFCDYGPYGQGAGGGGGGAGSNFIATSGAVVPTNTTSGHRTDVDNIGTVVITLPTSAPVFTSPTSFIAEPNFPTAVDFYTTGEPDGGTITKLDGAVPGMTFGQVGPGHARLFGQPLASAVGTYTLHLKATNLTGESFQTVTVRVVDRAYLDYPLEATFKTGEFTSFDITTRFGNPTPTISLVSGSLPPSLTLHDDGDGTATISGTPVDSEAGTYSVRLKADNGAVNTADYTITVVGPPPPPPAPVVTTQPQGQIVDAGTVATFTVSGSDVSSYVWQRLDGDTWQDLVDGSDVFSSRTNALSVRANTSATYRAALSNESGTAYSDPARLTVRPSTVWVAPTEAGGDDQGGANDCSDSGSPCETIQQALDSSSTRGVTVHLAGGFDYRGFVEDGDRFVTVQGPDDAVGTRITSPVLFNPVGGDKHLELTQLTLDGQGQAAVGVTACNGSVNVIRGRVTGWETGAQAGGPGCSSDEFSIVFLQRSTVDDNGTAAAAFGRGYLALHDSTVVHNGTAVDGDGAIELVRTLFANNGADACKPTVYELLNISDEATCGTGEFVNRSDLGPLVVANNGGPTASVLPGPSFPGRGAAEAPYCSGPDQRLQPVPSTRCDIGSVERQPSDPVNQSFTSADSTTFTVGVADSFAITTEGVTAISATGDLPAGVSFVDNGDGTATLSGTPAAGSGGSYPLQLTGSDGVGNEVTQAFTLTVNEAPTASIAATSESVAVGDTVTFTATLTGFPAPTLMWQRRDGKRGDWVTLAETSSVLTFTASSSDNRAVFRVVAFNASGSATSNAVSLRVTGGKGRR